MTTRRSSRPSPRRGRTAAESVETLTLGATAGDVFATVDPGKSKLSYQVLFDPDGAGTAVVTVVFRPRPNARTAPTSRS